MFILRVSFKLVTVHVVNFWFFCNFIFNSINKNYRLYNIKSDHLQPVFSLIFDYSSFNRHGCYPPICCFLCPKVESTLRLWRKSRNPPHLERSQVRAASFRGRATRNADRLGDPSDGSTDPWRSRRQICRWGRNGNPIVEHRASSCDRPSSP